MKKLIASFIFAPLAVLAVAFFVPVVNAQVQDSPTFCYTFTRDLGVGLPITDTEAGALDTILLKEGIAGDDFSTYDESVAARVVKLQAKYGITQTGYYGPITRAKMNSLYGCAITPIVVIPVECYQFNNNLTIGSMGADVVALQTTLIALGFDIPSISSGATAKGYFGVETESAVKLYQAGKGLPAVGFVGPLTRAELNKCTDTTNSITVLSPNGGEIYQQPVSSINYSGTVNYIPKKLVAHLYSPERNNVASTPLNLGSAGNFSGTFSGDPGIVNGLYKINICDELTDIPSLPGKSLCDSSDGFFTITSDSSNRSPVIIGLTAPTLLNVNQTGTWTIQASDPENGSLSYSVDWGEFVCPAGFICTANAGAVVQTSTFTHSYATAGTYTVKITVRDSAGLSAQTSATVVVGSSVQSPVINDVVVSDVLTKTITSSLQKGREYNIKWYQQNISNQVYVYLMKLVGSTWTRVLTIAAPSSPVGGGMNSTNWVPPLSLEADPNARYKIYVETIGAGGQQEVSFFIETKPNSAPVIINVSGPTTLKVGEYGSWAVMASDPENSWLSSSVNWGNGGSGGGGGSATGAPPTIQTKIFETAYSTAGTYTITFTVRDNAGLSAEKKVTVKVENAATTGILPTITTIVPSSSNPGNVIAIYGTNFALQGNTVFFTCPLTNGSSVNAATANIASNQGKVINIAVPGVTNFPVPVNTSLTNPGYCYVYVSNTNGVTNKFPFTVTR